MLLLLTRIVGVKRLAFALPFSPQRQLAFVGLAPLGVEPAAFRSQLGEPFATSSKRHARDAFPRELLALLRRVMMRHAKDQKVSRGGDGDGGAGRRLLELPPKHERVRGVALDAEEAAAYRRLESLAKARTYK